MRALAIVFLCTLLVVIQCDGVKVKIECEKNTSCENSETQYTYTIESMNITLSVCTKEACPEVEFTGTFVNCSKNVYGQ